jgi:hypothetical protein
MMLYRYIDIINAINNCFFFFFKEKTGYIYNFLKKKNPNRINIR